MTAIVWFRNDLRLEDNPALDFALKRYKHIIPLFIHSTEQGRWDSGAATNWWLHHSLKDLQKRFSESGIALIVRKGVPKKVLEDVVSESGANAVVWNRCYEPEVIRRDTQIKSTLIDRDVEVKSFPGNVLMEPWDTVNKQGKPYQVFTFFWKHLLTLYNPGTVKCLISKKAASSKNINTLKIEDLNLLPSIPWDKEFYQHWKPGSRYALEKLNHFIIKHVSDYPENRNFPSIDGVSMLSPYLHFGEISPRIVWETILKSHSFQDNGIEPYLRQLGWREFAHHLLYHFPKTPNSPLRPQFEQFPWNHDQKALQKWQQGQTGYPIVDAGMRQLWHTGWMHNRVRMIVGSFLVKDLLISWQEGARWFWDTLVDADLANNTLGWQWIGGCGADAAPYFRIFNPVLQSEKFDANGDYIRQWVPELKNLSNKWLHKPWMASSEILTHAGITLGKTYPFPIVDHNQARQEALRAFKSL